MQTATGYTFNRAGPGGILRTMACHVHGIGDKQIVNLLEFQIPGYDKGLQVLFRSLVKMETDLSVEGAVLQNRGRELIVFLGLLNPFFDNAGFSHREHALP
jgi:hypothetical protein